MKATFEDRSVDAAPLPLMLAPLGVPLCVELGRALDPGALLPAFEGWQGEARPCPSPARLRIERGDHLAGAEGTVVSAHGATVHISGPGVSARADAMAGCASCEVSADYIAAPQRLREDVLDPLVLMLMAWRDRAPLHAAGFIAGGLAVLLAGRSGAGKSCLAKAADSAGFQLLSEDIVYVQQSPGLRVWGWPRVAHLLPADAGRSTGPSRLRNGTRKQVVAFRSASIRALSADRAVLCVLGRGDTVSLSPIDAEAALARLLPLDPGFDLLPREICGAVRTLASRGAWDLRLFGDPAEAVSVLAANLSRLEHTAAS